MCIILITIFFFLEIIAILIKNFFLNYKERKKLKKRLFYNIKFNLKMCLVHNAWSHLDPY